MKIKAIVHVAEEGGFWAEVPALHGCVTEGDSMEEVMANLKDAIEGWLIVAERRSASRERSDDRDCCMKAFLGQKLSKVVVITGIFAGVLV